MTPLTPSCDRVLDALPHGGVPPELRAHADECAHCKASVQAYRLLGDVRTPSGPPPPLPPSLSFKTLPPARPWWIEALIATGAVLGMGVGTLITVGVRGPGGHPLMGAATAVALLTLIALGTWSGLSPNGRQLRVATVALAAVTAIAIVLGATGEGGDLPFWKAGIGCATTEIGATLPLVALLLWMLTRSAPGFLKAMAASFAAGAAGVFALHLHCPVRTTQHLFVFHVLPWMVLAAAAAWARGRLPTRSYAP